MVVISNGFLKKNTKAFRPDPDNGKWIGAKTKNGQFATIKPGWIGEFKIKNTSYKLELWAFNTRWGQQSMHYKLHKNIKIKDEEINDRSTEF